MRTRMKVVSFKADEEFIRRLKEYATKKNMTKSEVIRRAVEKYIKEEA